MHFIAPHPMGYLASPAGPQDLCSAGNALPTSEVEQSLIYCQDHKFANDNLMRPMVAPLFSEELLQHWRSRCAMRVVICCLFYRRV